MKESDETLSASEYTTTNWWVWFDQLLEEWFYSAQTPDSDPALAEQLKKEKTTIHQVQALSGAQAIEVVCPGYRDDRRQDQAVQPPQAPAPRVN